MNHSPNTEPTSNAGADEVELTALQQAIRKRALDTIAAEQARPPVPLSRRLLIIGLTLVAMLVFVVMVNFLVTGMFKILDIWYPGSISGRVTQPAPVRPVPKGLDEPFYITVDPPLETLPSEGAVSSGVTESKNPAH